MNVGLLNRNIHNLKDLLLLNSLHNIISACFVRSYYILHEDTPPLIHRIIRVTPDISDH